MLDARCAIVFFGLLALGAVNARTALGSCGDYLANELHQNREPHPAPSIPKCNGPQCRQAPLPPSSPQAPVRDGSTLDERIAPVSDLAIAPSDAGAVRRLLNDVAPASPVLSGILRPPRG